MNGSAELQWGPMCGWVAVCLAAVGCDGDGKQSVELTEQGVAFVVPEVPTSRGEVSIRGVSGRSSPFQGAVRRCQGAEHCTIMRAACFDGSCRNTIAYPNGFDVIRVEASVVGAE